MANPSWEAASHSLASQQAKGVPSMSSAAIETADARWMASPARRACS